MSEHSGASDGLADGPADGPADGLADGLADRLPDGLTTRPLTMADTQAVFEVMAAQELVDLGKIEIEEADIVGDWQKPSFDVGASTIGVFDGDTLAAYAEVNKGGRGDAAVHPSYRRRGLGTALAGWMPARTGALGGTVIGSPVPQGSAGDVLLEKLGWHVRWTSWMLELPEGTQVPDRPLPDGYRIRAATPDDYQAALDVKEDAFLEWSERERESLEDFLSVTVRRPGFEPWYFRLVTDPSDEIVGTLLLSLYGEPPTETFISQLAVRRDQRHRGLAQALLVDAFARGREHGATRSALSTDSRTGALGLYEKVGMVVGNVWLNRAIEV